LPVKMAKSRTRGRKLHWTEAKARVGGARKTRADLEQELKACRRQIANARERLAEAAMQQTATAEMLRIISNSPIQSVLDAVAENAARLCDANNAEIFRLEDNLLRLAASYGKIPVVIHAYQGVPVNRETVTGRAACDRRTIQVHDLAAEEGEYPVGSGNAKREGHRTTLGTPLLREGVPVGVILVRRREVRPFSDEQMALIETFADQAAIAIENARLFETEQQRTLALARANRDLAEREAKIRRLVESNIIGIFVWDFQGHVLEANDEFLRMVNYDREDLALGRIKWADLTPPDWRDRNNARIEQQKASGRFEPFEKEYTRKDGSRVPVLIGGATFEEGGNQGVAFVLDLTERKRAEQALMRSEAYLVETQKLTHTGSWAWNARSQTVLYCSEEMFRIYGLDPQQDLPTRKNFRQRVHPEDRNRVDERFARVVNEKVDSFDEYRVVLPDGTIKHVNSSGHPVLDGNGEFIEFIGTATDVTERKRAEEALREREAKIRRLVDSNIIGIFFSGLEGLVLEANDAFLHLVGQNRDDLVSGRIRWTDLTPPEWRERDRRALAELSSNTIAQPYEKEFFRKDGSRVPVLVGGALFEEGGDEGVAFVLDLTDRKCAEEALLESEYKLRQIIDTVPGFLWSGDPAGEPTHINQHMSNYSGMRFEDFKHGGWEAFVHPADFPETAKAFDHAIRSGTPYQDVMRLRRADGEFRWYHVRGEPLRDPQGRIIQWYGLSVDIDEAKKAEDRLRRSESSLAEAQLQLAHANRVATMGQLTASITHEVNQPITAAVTYALAARRWLRAEPPNFHEADDALTLIVKEGIRAGEVVGRVRALIKKAPARKDAVAINDAILEVIALTRAEAANNRVSVRTQLAEGLPHVQGDRVQLQQVLLNLIINAIEAMRDVGEEERELLISSRNEPDGVSVEVRDSGPGFAPADIDRVFEAFYTTKPDGVGLGLSICRSIIEAHDGRLWASPNMPRGAIFGFIAPAHPIAA
jgi:PAS domain S-box-containing protein